MLYEPYGRCFVQAEDGIRDYKVTGVQTCALPIYASQGQYDKARTALEMAIRTHPSYATAHENLGDIYAKMASQAYDKALQLDHGNTATQTKLAMIQNLFAGGTRNKETPVRNTPVPSKAEGP